jgi:hypothetical protein
MYLLHEPYLKRIREGPSKTTGIDEDIEWRIVRERELGSECWMELTQY